MKQAILTVAFGLLVGIGLERCQRTSISEGSAAQDSNPTLMLTRHAPADAHAILGEPDIRATEKLAAVAAQPLPETVGGLLAILERIDALEDSPEVDFAVIRVVRKLVEVGPADAYQRLLEQRHLQKQTAYLDKLVALWTGEDLDEALAVIEAADAGPRTAEFLMEAASGRRPLLFLELAREHGETREWVIRNAINALAKTDPKRAIEEALKFSNENVRVRGLLAAVETLARSDPDAALEAVRSANSNQPHVKAELWYNLLFGMAAEDPLEAAAFLESSVEDGYHENARAGFAVAWARSDPDAAAEWVRGLDDQSVRETLLAKISEELVDTDVHRAWDLFVESGSKRQPYQLVEKWIETDLQGARDAIQQLGPEMAELKADAAGRMLNHLIHKEPGLIDDHLDTLLKWMNDAEDDHTPHVQIGLGRDRLQEIADRYPEMMQRVLPDMVSSLADEDLGSAEFIYHQISDPEAKRGTLATLILHWTEQDPRGAADWLAQQPQDSGRAHAFGQLADAWTRLDPGGAANWIESLDNPSERDSAVKRYIEIMYRRDPDTALEFAESLSDSTMREDWIVKAWTGKFQSDFDAAETALAEADLPALSPRARQKLDEIVTETANWNDLARRE